jgi:hypothetical protein
MGNDRMLEALAQAEWERDARYVESEVRVQEALAERFMAGIRDMNQGLDCKIRRREVDDDGSTLCVIEVSGRVGSAFVGYLVHLGFTTEILRRKANLNLAELEASEA